MRDVVSGRYLAQEAVHDEDAVVDTDAEVAQQVGVDKQESGKGAI